MHSLLDVINFRNADYDNNTLLQIAVIRNDIDWVKFLLSFDVDLTIPNDAGKSTIDLIADHENNELRDVLLKFAESKNYFERYENKTDLEALTKLVSDGNIANFVAALNMPNYGNPTEPERQTLDTIINCESLIVAVVEKGNIDILKLFLKWGLDVNINALDICLT